MPMEAFILCLERAYLDNLTMFCYNNDEVSNYESGCVRVTFFPL